MIWFVFSLKKSLICKNIIKTDELYYKLRRGKTYNLAEYSLPIVFKRYIWRILSSFATELKNVNKGRKTIKK